MTGKVEKRRRYPAEPDSAFSSGKVSEKQLLPQKHQKGDVQRVEGVEEIFRGFSLNKASFPVIHIDAYEGEAGLPFIMKPAASDNCLRGFFAAEPVHNKKEDEALPAVVCLKKVRYRKERRRTEKLHHLVFAEIFQSAEGKVAQQKGKKYVLLFVAPGVFEQKIPWNF